MRTKSIFIATLVGAVLLASTALAQVNLNSPEHGVSFTGPEGWINVEGNDRAIFNVKHEESQSQIEVIATTLMSADVANVFYETFHETLVQSNFTRGSQEETDIGAHHGFESQYTFDYAGVELRIVVFHFTQESTAFLVVGYIKADEFEQHYAAYREAVSSLTFEG